ncbi:DNA-binding protein [Ktedonosporobacter rubrisoli]|uniref:DNA-binding protein n=1 Tax=Ktedonosporobacter rubrisoli TaxID=2509675 RepID=A0A4P6K4S4_KTERU|nr:helix-turn-helix domain-containing protein [Ktedonosporobacter rubrisoli]QBD82962.1 DNA-binding protein [Ktedonosporobacter rubrisoli]
MDEYADYSGLPGYVSIKEAAKMLGISDKMVYIYIQRKRLPALQIANVLVIPIKDVQNFKFNSEGRPRRKTPPWRISSRDNVLFVTSITLQFEAAQQDLLAERLREIRESGLYDFPGTVTRYVFSYEGSPNTIEIQLVWKTSVAPDEATREQTLEEFRQALDDVLDWSTAQYKHGRALMHT